MPLYTHKQISAVKMLLAHDGGFVWHRVGTGKTRIAYLWFAMIAKRCDNPLPIFIVVCRRKAFEDWFEEAKLKLGFNWTVCNYETYSWPKRNRPTVLLVSHGVIHKVLPDLMELSAVLEGIVFDEGYLYSNSQTKHGKSAHKLSERIGIAAIMSGSIMTARNVENIYGQAYAINRNRLLARTLTEFRSRYQFQFQLGNSPHKVSLAKAGAKERILSNLRGQFSTYFPKSERELREIPRHVEPSKTQRDFIARLKLDYLLEISGSYIEIKNAPSLITRCQQISDGFLPMSEGVVDVPSTKMDYLLDFVAELLAEGEKVVIWCAFKESVRRILQALQKVKTKGVYGMVGGKGFDHIGWRRDGKVAVATEDSGSSVNHFEQCAHSIYYSMSWKWLSLQQSRGRTDRKSSRHETAFYYYLFTKESLDEFVFDTAVASGKAEEELINYSKLKQWLSQTPAVM